MALRTLRAWIRPFVVVEVAITITYAGSLIYGIFTDLPSPPDIFAFLWLFPLLPAQLFIYWSVAHSSRRATLLLVLRGLLVVAYGLNSASGYHARRDVLDYLSYVGIALLIEAGAYWAVKRRIQSLHTVGITNAASRSTLSQ